MTLTKEIITILHMLNDGMITANDVKKTLPHLTKPQIIERIDVIMTLGFPIKIEKVPGKKHTYYYKLG